MIAICVSVRVAVHCQVVTEVQGIDFDLFTISLAPNVSGSMAMIFMLLDDLGYQTAVFPEQEAVGSSCIDLGKWFPNLQNCWSSVST